MIMQPTFRRLVLFLKLKYISVYLSVTIKCKTQTGHLMALSALENIQNSAILPSLQLHSTQQDSKRGVDFVLVQNTTWYKL